MKAIASFNLIVYFIATLQIKRLLESLSTYDVTPSRVTETWDLVQTELECCGVNGDQDYNITPFYQKKNHLPNACCGPLQLDEFGHAEKCR